MPRKYHAVCQTCGRTYDGVSPSFCSRSCYVAEKWVERTCEYCEKSFQARRIYVNRGQMHFCSERCAHLSTRKNQPIEFGGDVFYLNVHGYYASAKTGNLLHREIWRSQNGEIPFRHVVHHKDENKSNNSIG